MIAGLLRLVATYWIAATRTGHETRTESAKAQGENTPVARAGEARPQAPAAPSTAASAPANRKTIPTEQARMSRA
jgi:hypothetical protein